MYEIYNTLNYINKYGYLAGSNLYRIVNEPRAWGSARYKPELESEPEF